MPSLVSPLTDNPDHPNVAAYKAARAAGATWCRKVMDRADALGFDVISAAKKLSLSFEEKTVIFEDEIEEPALVDFYLFDYRPKGKSLAESCGFAPGDLTPLESEIHRDGLAARTSLFEICEVHAELPQMLLRDRLNPTAPDLWLTDLSLSATFRRRDRQVFMFTRAIAHRSIHHTGGFSFLFEEKTGTALVDEYRRAMWSVPVPLRDRRRTGWFLLRNRQHGLAQVGADVAPSSAP